MDRTSSSVCPAITVRHPPEKSDKATLSVSQSGRSRRRTCAMSANTPRILCHGRRPVQPTIPRRMVTQKRVVSKGGRNYLTDMEKLAYSFAAKRLMALVMCLALMITGMSAAVAMDHQGHENSGYAASTASDPEMMGHASHHMPSGVTDPRCCDPEPTAASSCHVSACCLSALSYSDILVSANPGRSTSVQSMAYLVGPSIDTPLPERPPRLS